MFQTEFRLTDLFLMESSIFLFGQVHFQFKGYLFFVLVLSFIIKIPVNNKNSVDSDQTSRFVASDLGLYYILVSLLWDTRHIRVKPMFRRRLQLYKRLQTTTLSYEASR